MTWGWLWIYLGVILVGMLPLGYWYDECTSVFDGDSGPPAFLVVMFWPISLLILIPVAIIRLGHSIRKRHDRQKQEQEEFRKKAASTGW